jgi:aminoglycoside phosphotransferase (APT) family kinase protein
VEINAALVGRLIADQFPQWAHLAVRPVAFDGWDNRTFRLGDEMAVRLPSAERYRLQVEKEQAWLPKLAPHLPLAVPTPLALGRPADAYPWPWSIYHWIDGEIATRARIDDPRSFATAVAGFLVALQGIDAAGGPPPGPHNFYRGGPLTVYDGETRRAIAALEGIIDTRQALEVWEAGLAATWHGSPVWVHGDVSPGNLLVADGQLSAVIDFGCCGVGDPACDLTITWTFFSGDSRAAFRKALPLDRATWARSRGWALWKALITLAGHIETDPTQAEEAQRVICDVLNDHLLHSTRTSWRVTYDVRFAMQPSADMST